MALKVFDLQCSNGHIFEGWFHPGKSFEDQAQQGLLSCPICNDVSIERKLSAPRLGLSRRSQTQENTAREGAQGSESNAATVMAPSEAQLARMQAEMLKQMRDLVRSSEDVGARFAEEALKIHHGQAKERAIRGTATQKERRELADEGVTVVALPDFLDDDQLQ